MENISLLVAFTAGLLSFASPCVLPLAPVYLASLYGPDIFEPTAKRRRIPLFLHALSFVVGFSIIFIIMGAIAGLTGYAINPSQALLNKISGSLMLGFGVFILAAIKIPWLNYEKHMTSSRSSAIGYSRSFLIGAAFAPAWTACVGPILGGILTLALNSATAWHGAYLLSIYSLGLGLPFLIIGAAFNSITPLLRRIHRHSAKFQLIGGLLLIAVGILILTNNLARIASLTW